MKDLEERAIKYFDNNKPKPYSEYGLIKMMTAFAEQESKVAVNAKLQEAADKAKVEVFRVGGYDPAALNNFGYRVDKESILSLKIT